MEVQLIIDGHLIGSLPVNPFKVNNPGYFTYLQRQLEEEYEDIIELHEEQPVEFFLHGIPSRINTFTPLFPPSKKSLE